MSDGKLNMNKLLSLGVVALLIGMIAMTLFASQERGGNEGMRERFVGAWRLAWLEEEGADGEIHRADCTGLLVYTRDGHVPVQVMYRNRGQEPMPRRCNTRRAATRPPLAHMRSTKALTPSPSTLRAHW
jgi:hypothetical protein